MKRLYYSLINISLLFLVLTGTSCKREKLSDQVEKYKLERLLALKDGELQIPDFSFAGFERNEIAIPNVPVTITIQPEEGDDGRRIQQAIDLVSASPLVNGYRGAVLLKAGTYQVENPININYSGVVVRGEGQSENGTVILSTSKASRNREFTLIKIAGDGEGYLETGTQTDITKDTVAVGTKKISVTSSAGYNVGDTIVLVRTPNQAWINTIGMGQYGWTPKAYQIQHLRIIEKVEPNAIYVDIPVVDAIYKKFGGGYVSKASVKGRIYHSGLENIRLQSSYVSDDDENHAWTAIQMSRATNCWVKNVTAQFFALSCIALYNQSDFNTIQDCAMLDPKSQPIGERRYSFFINSGMGNLFQRCFTRSGRHDFSTGSRVTGPNVFLDCLATETLGDSGPHHRWATGLLFDNISGGILRVSNRKDTGTGQGWTGAQIMYWNSVATIGIGIYSPPAATNWGVGCKASQIWGEGDYISQGHPVDPRSIFLSQLERRLGSEAVIRITNNAQREGSELSELANWAGN